MQDFSFRSKWRGFMFFTAVSSMVWLESNYSVFLNKLYGIDIIKKISNSSL